MLTAFKNWLHRRRINRGHVILFYGYKITPIRPLYGYGWEFKSENWPKPPHNQLYVATGFGTSISQCKWKILDYEMGALQAGTRCMPWDSRRMDPDERVRAVNRVTAMYGQLRGTRWR